MITQADHGTGVGHLTHPVAMSAHFGPTHVLADVAARNCAPHRSPFAGPGACGACWELAIRDDERFATEFDLPRELTADPDYVDEVAVDLACRGELVELTAAEFAAAVRRLTAKRVTPNRIALRLRASYRAVINALTTRMDGVAA